MKIKMILEDDGNQPSFSSKVEGEDPEKKSLAFSVYVLLRMVMDLLNTDNRNNLVSLIATLHKGYREDAIEAVEVEDDNTAPRHLH